MRLQNKCQKYVKDQVYVRHTVGGGGAALHGAERLLFYPPQSTDRLSKIDFLLKVLHRMSPNSTHRNCSNFETIQCSQIFVKLQEQRRENHATNLGMATAVVCEINHRNGATEVQVSFEQVGNELSGDQNTGSSSFSISKLQISHHKKRNEIENEIILLSTIAAILKKLIINCLFPRSKTFF